MQGWEAMPMQARSVTPRGGGADQEADHLLIASRAQWGSGRFMATRLGLSSGGTGSEGNRPPRRALRFSICLSQRSLSAPPPARFQPDVLARIRASRPRASTGAALESQPTYAQFLSKFYSNAPIALGTLSEQHTCMHPLHRTNRFRNAVC